MLNRDMVEYMVGRIQESGHCRTGDLVMKAGAPYERKLTNIRIVGLESGKSYMRSI